MKPGVEYKLVRLPKDLHAKCRIAAINKGVTLTTFMERLIEGALGIEPSRRHKSASRSAPLVEHKHATQHIRAEDAGLGDVLSAPSSPARPETWSR